MDGETLVGWTIAICICLAIGSCTVNDIYKTWHTPDCTSNSTPH
jgi:hypothetical protein